MKTDSVREKLADKGLRITPQRMAVLEAVIVLDNHPTAENISEYLRVNQPNISTGTIYKILDILVRNDIIRKVRTDGDAMRYDAVLESHHHLYCADSERIEDYVDKELSTMLDDYFKRKSIPNFRVKDINLHIIGNFIKTKT